MPSKWSKIFNRKPYSDKAYLARDPIALASTWVDLDPIENDQLRDHVRSSGLYHDCVRYFVLLQQNKVIPPKEKVNFKSRITLGMGTAMHSWLQNEPDVFGDKRGGLWKCRACGSVTEFSGPRKDRCICGANPEAFIYEEIGLSWTKYGLTGHPDMFLWNGEQYVLCEFKTINGDDFMKLEAPLVAHVWQVTCYLHMLGFLPDHGDLKLADEAQIFYFSKMQHRTEFPMKTFKISLQREVLKAITEKLEVYYQGIKQGIIPPCDPECRSDSWQRKTCHTKDHCERG